MRFELKGRIDSNNASMVEKELMSRLMEEKGASVELDAAELEYISSAGLRVLLTSYKKMAEQGTMKITNINEVIREYREERRQKNQNNNQ